MAQVTTNPTKVFIHGVICDCCVITVVVIYTPQKRETNGGSAQVCSS